MLDLKRSQSGSLHYHQLSMFHLILCRSKAVPWLLLQQLRLMTLINSIGHSACFPTAVAAAACLPLYVGHVCSHVHLQDPNRREWSSTSLGLLFPRHRRSIKPYILMFNTYMFTAGYPFASLALLFSNALFINPYTVLSILQAATPEGYKPISCGNVILLMSLPPDAFGLCGN